MNAARAERVREAGARPQAHAKVACTRKRTRRSPAPAREAGAHTHAKLAVDLWLRVVRPVVIGALLDRLASLSRLCSARSAETAHEKPFLFLW